MQQAGKPNQGVVSRPVLIALVLLLSACAGQPQRTEEARQDAPPEQSTRTPATVAPEPLNSGVREASDSLLADARSARAQGRLDAADRLLQRAQRIDPANPGVYIELAELYAQRGQVAASRTAAQRGLLYCEGESCPALRRLASP